MVFTYSIFSRSEITCKSREDSMFYIKFYQELFIISKGHITSTNKTLVMIFTLLTDGGLVTDLCRTLATLWTVALQAPLSMGFPRQEYWSELPFPSPGDLPDPAIKPETSCVSCIAGRCFTTEPPGKPKLLISSPLFVSVSIVCVHGDHI